ncbi:MAG TPA: adenylate/guanylate cyclase domain-containing protein [Chloroflexota bacterium]|jgi:class 3 adenylate cyclase/tetratricopeptide (TPR) repeat protein
MRCGQCQAENPEGARFCEDCGNRLEFTCPHCGEAATAGKRFCASCGGSLTDAPTPSPSAPAPYDYTPHHLAERIIASRGALEGERKQVTVLFADLKGSLELLADRDPEEARRILDPVLERMMEAVHRYEGTVNQVLGDGIMALFGAPLAHEDHAVRACYAALRMQESVKGYAATVLRTHGLRVQIRVGLNSGEVVVRSIGSDLRMDYTAVGQTTHLAARMEQTAVPGSILIAPDTLRLVEGYLAVKALGPVPIKGLDAPVDIYEVVGAGPSRSRLQAAAARGLTRFVGREAELHVLRDTLERAGGRHGQMVALIGEPGVGKSRLAWEFTHSHRVQGWLTLRAGSVSYGRATSYLPVIDLLQSYCGIDAQDDHRRMRQKVLGKVLDLDRALEPTLSALLALLDVPVDDAAWAALDPPQRRQRTLDALKRLLLRESQEQPLLLVFEDLHWIDAETQALLDSLVESLPTARLLLLVNYRPEYEHGWHRKTYYRELRLDPLPPASAHELLDTLLGDDAELTPLKRLLIDRTEGNPFFLEESVRTLGETGALGGEPGAYRLLQPVERTRVPATVQAVLAARIDRLAPDDKRLLQAAAVVGKDVSYALLRAVVEEPEAALRQRLGALQAAEFLYETSLFPDLEYTFKHALTHEVAYGSMLQERRRELHARIAVAIEAIYSDRLAEHVERLSHHALRGELWAKAVDYLRQAGHRAEARSAYHEAATYYEQAVAALGYLPVTRDTQELDVDLRIDLRGVLTPLGEMLRLLPHLQAAEALAAALADQRRQGAVASAMTVCCLQRGERAAMEYGQRALAIATALEDRALEAEARFRLGIAYHRFSRYREATGVLARNLDLLVGELGRARLGAIVTSAGTRAILAECLVQMGEFAEARIRGEEAIALAAAVGHPLTTAATYRGVALLYLAQGDLDRATALFERCLMVGQAAHLQAFCSVSAAGIGYARVLAGRAGEGLPMLERAVEQAPTSPGFGLGSYAAYVLWLADAYLLTRRVDDAGRLAGRALAAARRRDEPDTEAGALCTLGEIAARAEPLDVAGAEALLQQGLTRAKQLGMRPLVAHCRRGLGTLYQKIERGADARAQLSAAAAMYRAMDMTYWLTKAETALAHVVS